jgi:DNA-binding response OmpR family regulator
MFRDEKAEVGYTLAGDAHVFDLAQFEPQKRTQEDARAAAPYRVTLAGEPIALTYTEYRILQYLVRRPYYAFSRAQIVAAVHTDDSPLSDRTLNDHIRTLRDKLGQFSDYVQTVPYIGYRFKQ